MRLAFLVFHLHVFLAADLLHPVAAMREARHAAADIHRATGVRFHITHETVPALPYENQGITFEPSPKYYLREISRFDLKPKHHLYLFLVAPQKDAAGSDIPNGAASLCGIKHGPPSAYATAVTGPIALGARDRSASVNRYVIEHELLHILGAQHTKHVSVMIPGNFSYLSAQQPELPILRRSVTQISKCVSEREKSPAKRSAEDSKTKQTLTCPLTLQGRKSDGNRAAEF